MRLLLRRYLPAELRLAVRLRRRWMADRRHGVRFATRRGSGEMFPFEVSSYELPFIDYPGQEALAKAKRKNQAILAAALTGTVIQRGETFSVWRLASRPTRRLGYEDAAALKHGELTTDIGGAICLLSTVLYNVALLGAFRITERHCHSVDSYGDRRYFQLGRDAAIEYGYRDLRFVNTHEVPLRIDVDVREDRVWAAARAPVPLPLDVTIQVTAPEVLHAADPVVVMDASLGRGEEAVISPSLPGLRMRTYRTIRWEDGRTTTEDLGESVHLPSPLKLRRAPASVPTRG